MWILESPGDFLSGKRLWLKPGKKYLFGRVKKDGVRFAIDHKNVSRKHFVIEISEPQDGEVGQIHSRTKIKIIDQNSKSGTTVNGHILKGTNLPSRELTEADNSVRPGNAQELIIRWHPCVFTFNLLKKDLKAGILRQKQTRIQSLGLKALAEFAPDHTTHLVVAKRNTPKGLQALITGKHLVDESFIDAIEYAATPNSLDADEDASHLELDFDTAWPSEKDHLPAPGREPSARPVETYQPGPDRSHIFEGYTFIFGDQSQYDNLLPVITTGHGKAHCLKVTEGETSVDQVYEYMQNATGKKSSSRSQLQSARDGVVLVRWDSKSENKEWTSSLIDQVALRMDQMAVDQSEFLDAILANDVSLLLRPIPTESKTERRVAPPPSTASPSNPVIKPSSEAVPQPRTVNGNHAPVQSPSQTRVSSHQAHALSENQQSDAQADRDHSQGPGEDDHRPAKSRKDRVRLPPPQKKEFDDGFNPNNVASDDESEEDAIKEEPQSTRKRKRSPTPEQVGGDSFDEDMDDLLPAATAMKRRKLELEAEAKRKGLPVPTMFESTPSALKSKKKRKEVEIDVREVARAQREKEVEEAQKRRERLENLPPINENDKTPANLVVIETLELPVRSQRAVTRVNPEDDSRWDPRWNGRKNFKKYRPQQAGPERRTGHAAKVIVPLIEVKRKSDGLGEKYWDTPAEEKERLRKRKEKQRSQRTQSTNSESQTMRGTGTTAASAADKLDEFDFDSGSDQPRVNRRTVSPVATRLQEEQEEAEAIVGHDIDLDSPRRTRGDDARARTQTQTQDGTQTNTHGTKRKANKGKAPAQAKKQKTLPVTVVHGSDSDESDDGMQFRFGTRGDRRLAKA